MTHILRRQIVPLWAVSLASLTMGLALTENCRVLATPADASVSAPVPYVISPDDQLDISVLGHEELKGSVTILPDGTFNFPILNTVHAAGMTVEGLTQVIRTGLIRSGQVNMPQVTVSIRESRPRKVSILGGGSKSPGQYECKTGMHLLDLLAASGGPAQEPELTQATLVTAGGKDSTAIDLVPLLSGTDTSQNLPLLPGDILFLSARSPELAEVQVVGDVSRPGAYSIMPSGISVLALLNQAGGALPAAALTQTQILHGGQVQTINLRPLLTSDLTSRAGQARLVPGDVLLVPDNKNRILALGEVRSPGIYPLPEDQALTLTTAYALVGGATPDGDKKNVSIIRRSPGGKATLLAINMDDVLQGRKGVTDIPLQPNDILFIQTRNHPKSVGDILSSLSPLYLLGTLAKTGL